MSLACQIEAGHAQIADDEIDFAQLDAPDRRLAVLALVDAVMQSSNQAVDIAEDTLAIVGLMASVCGVSIDEVNEVGRLAAEAAEAAEEQED